MPIKEYVAPDGTKWKSIAEYCRANGYSYKSVTHKMHRGVPEEYVFANRYACKDHKGIEYPSEKAKCDAYGVSQGAYIQRKKKGMSEQEALETPIKKARKLSFEEVSAIKKANIPRYVYNRRIRDGMSKEEAVTTPVKSLKNAIIDPWGNTFDSEAEMCRFHKLDYKIYHARTCDQGWSIEKALKTPIRLKAEEHVGETNVSKCGLKISIIELDNSHGCCYVVRFEDNSIKNKISYYDFKRGDVAHPTLQINKRRGFFCGYITKHIGTDSEGNVWYETEKGGVKDIMTPQMMMAAANIQRNSNES